MWCEFQACWFHWGGGRDSISLGFPHHLHMARLTHFALVSVNWVSIGSDSGLLPDRHQAFIWSNARILLIRPLGANFSESRFKIQNFSFMKMHLKMLSAKPRPFCPGGDALTKELLQEVSVILKIWFSIHFMKNSKTKYYYNQFW